VASSYGLAEARGPSSADQITSPDAAATPSPRKTSDQTNIEEPEPEKLMETPTIKTELPMTSEEEIAEAVEEEVLEKNIEQEHFEIESIKESNKESSHRNTKHNLVVEMECQQEESAKEESKAESPESCSMLEVPGAAELVNGGVELAIHDESNFQDAIDKALEVANGE